MPLYKVDFTDNIPIVAAEISGDDFTTLKEFDVIDEHTYIKWYIVQAESHNNAVELAGKLVNQIWGDELYNSHPPPEH